MATASELLGGNILIIDVNSRTIKIPEAIKNLGVESDDAVQKLTFSIPQYYNGVDFSTFNIRINYSNARGGGDVGNVTDIRIEDETIYFTWVVERFAFMFPGSVEFVVCLREIDDEGVVLREFNTTTATLPVLKGKETANAAVEAERDLIAVAASEAAKIVEADFEAILDELHTYAQSVIGGES